MMAPAAPRSNEQPDGIGRAGAPPPEHTPHLLLAKPYDDADNWGPDYRAAMDVLDAHPGIRVVAATTEVVSPFEGQMVYDRSVGAYKGYSLLSGWTASLGGPTTNYVANNVFSEGSCSPGTISTVVSIVVPTGYRLRGYSVTANGDALVKLQVNGITQVAGRIIALSPTVTLLLPTPLAVPAGQTVQVLYECLATGTCTHDATIFGETSG